MDRRFTKISQRRLLLGLVIVLLGVSAVLFWKAHIQKPSAPIKEKAESEELAKHKETPEPKEEEPPLPATSRGKVVLQSSLAGKWYPGDAETLSKQIEVFFQKAQIQPIENVIALILPHAGYQFSGQTAVLGLKTTDKEYKRVVIIGPSHRVPMEEVLSVPRVTHYETPLGQIPLDLEFIDKLLDYSVFQNIPQTHKYEHSVQIELPLLQHRLQSFKLVPIVAGSCSLETISKAGAILRSLVDKETLVIASSDFVHYGRSYGYVPFTENVPEQIKKLNAGAYEFIKALDCEGFLEYHRKTGATICGYVPIAILLSMLPDSRDPILQKDGKMGTPTQAHLVSETSSGEITGDFTNSVSYLSIAFSGAWGNYPEIEPQRSNVELTEEDKKQLLTLARESIVYALQKRRVPQASNSNVTISDAMRHPRAAFVTLKTRDSSLVTRDPSGERRATSDELRGCVGDIFPQRPLYKSVIINAISAAINDRRFRPVTKDECSNITIEISALTVPEPIASPDEIRINIDGVVLSKNGQSAVFLPQVALEQGWNVNQTLTHLSLKARLPEDAWKEGANFLVFQAVVFGENEK